MNKQYLIWPAFIVTVLVQLYVPTNMILNKQDTLKTGEIYKFKTAPVDPYDPFRGKYITLSYKQNSIKVADEHNWSKGDPIYVTVEKDSAGFARLTSVAKAPPAGNSGYIKANVDYTITNDSTKILIDYPFKRFYMNEFKVDSAEEKHAEALSDTSATTYALVSIKEGDAALRDLVINGQSIKALLKDNDS